MGKGFDKFKKWVDDSSKAINDSARALEHRFKKEVKHYQGQNELNEAFDNASYTYEIVGTTNWANKPKRVRGFLVENDLKVLFKIDDENHEAIVKNALLKDVNDESIIQIDKVIRDEMVYLDLNVGDETIPVGCFYATYKAQDIPKDAKNVIKVEEDEVVGKVHFHVKD